MGPRRPDVRDEDRARLIERELALTALTRHEQENLRRRIELRLWRLRERLVEAERHAREHRDRQLA
jgi:hypothetical protein